MTTNKTTLLSIIATFLVITLCAESQAENLLEYVDTHIGTGGHGHTFLGSSVPFGAIQAGPNNFHQGWDWCSGYHYSDDLIKGFSHLHLSGTGCSDLGDILLMPYTGPMKSSAGSREDPHKGYASHYSHDNETARPHYYSVLLDRYNVTVELTATERTAMHRYTYPKGKDARLVVDLWEGNGDRATETHMKRIDDNTYGGYRFSRGWAKDQRVFFAITVKNSVKDLQLFDDRKHIDGDSAKGRAVKGVLTFSSTETPVLLKVSISPVSIAGALANMKTEMDHWDFQKVVDDSEKLWSEQLSKVAIEADTDTTKRIFYTAMYHTMIAPVLFNDSNKDYRGTDKKVYSDNDFNNYSIFSLWDTYRTQHPWLTIFQPERVGDMMTSMLKIYEQQGSLPVWHLMGCETDTMVGYHAVPPLVDAYFKGFEFDHELAYEAMKATAMRKGYRGLGMLMDNGYIGADKENEAVAKALEYAIDDACIALMAQALGKDEDAEYFGKRSKTYSEYFDTNTQFMRGKMSDGSWRTPFDPVASTHRKDDYCEGNAWQYTWLVPHDPQGLIDLFGSEEAFISKLDALFVQPSEKSDHASMDISGLIGQYAHGNEPGHHITYIYAFAGQQWKTAEKVRRILATMYNDKLDGLSGNEDCGQMSAWYIMSAMGFYPVHPANGKYVLGSPALNKVSIELANGRTFTMEAKNNSDKNIYIQAATYDGKPYTRSYITHKMIVDGGTLVLEMGDTPNKKFGSAKSDRPTSAL